MKELSTFTPLFNSLFFHLFFQSSLHFVSLSSLFHSFSTKPSWKPLTIFLLLSSFSSSSFLQTVSSTAGATDLHFFPLLLLFFFFFTPPPQRDNGGRVIDAQSGVAAGDRSGGVTCDPKSVYGGAGRGVPRDLDRRHYSGAPDQLPLALPRQESHGKEAGEAAPTST